MQEGPNAKTAKKSGSSAEIEVQKWEKVMI
jgi:hypothetical protein